jgi:hypothetical protein
MKEGNKWKKPEVIIAIMSSIIAICAIVIAYNEGQATRKHNRLSLRPLLVVTLTCDNKITKLHLENHGLGPAVIDKIKFIYHGKTFEPRTENWKALFAQIGLRYSYTMTFLSADEVIIKPDKETILIEIEHNAKDAETIDKFMSEIETKLDYRSLYDEPFSILTRIKK